jgi:hypothetical protein
VTLQSKSHVEGNLFHKSLSVEQDTHFEGESRPSEDQTMSAQGMTPKPLKIILAGHAASAAQGELDGMRWLMSATPDRRVWLRPPLSIL